MEVKFSEDCRYKDTELYLPKLEWKSDKSREEAYIYDFAVLDKNISKIAADYKIGKDTIADILNKNNINERGELVFLTLIPRNTVEELITEYINTCNKEVYTFREFFANHEELLNALRDSEEQARPSKFGGRQTYNGLMGFNNTTISKFKVHNWSDLDKDTFLKNKVLIHYKDVGYIDVLAITLRDEKLKQFLKGNKAKYIESMAYIVLGKLS